MLTSGSELSNKGRMMPLWFKMAVLTSFAGRTAFEMLATAGTAQAAISMKPPPSAKLSPPPKPSPPSPPASCRFCFNLSVTNYSTMKPLTSVDCTAIRSNLTTAITALFSDSFDGSLSPFTGGCNVSTGAITACAAITPSKDPWKPSSVTITRAFQTVLRDSLFFYLYRWMNVQTACSKKLTFTGSVSSTGFCLPGHTHTVSCSAT
ncbi:hypothetical protein VaNZ11_016243 [Volvox africanus]|uniref:Pherophorin domain-containing protein n=1 Tax=Volvox africanus TaxID=51714 RepID=A0ABQ5SNY9_9CHLO|nr:hypothetical protein VaNZ11_016243 [Volvox africanus]